jgi:hypothetical protein
LLRSAAEYAHGDETAGTKYRVAWRDWTNAEN